MGATTFFQPRVLQGPGASRRGRRSERQRRKGDDGFTAEAQRTQKMRREDGGGFLCALRVSAVRIRLPANAPPSHVTGQDHRPPAIPEKFRHYAAMILWLYCQRNPGRSAPSGRTRPDCGRKAFSCPWKCAVNGEGWLTENRSTVLFCRPPPRRPAQSMKISSEKGSFYG